MRDNLGRHDPLRGKTTNILPKDERDPTYSNRPKLQMSGRVCLGVDGKICGATLSRFNQEELCSVCLQKREIINQEKSFKNRKKAVKKWNRKNFLKKKRLQAHALRQRTSDINESLSARLREATASR